MLATGKDVVGGLYQCAPNLRVCKPGILNPYGRGVERDYVRAHKMYDVAASKASIDTNRKAAEKKRDYVMKKMSPLERARAR